MKKIIILLMTLFIKFTFAGPITEIFVSFSMPETLVRETLIEATKLKMPIYLNGLYKNSMDETLKKILILSKTIPNLSLQINPIAFKKYEISKVPALVVSSNQGFDILYGNLSIKEGLARIADVHNDSGLSQEDVKGIR